MSNNTIKKILIPVCAVFFSCFVCICCMIAFVGGLVAFYDSTFLESIFPTDVWEDINQTSEFDIDEEGIPIEDFVITDQYELTQSETEMMLQSAFYEDEFIEVADWAYEMGIVDLYAAQPCCGAVTVYNDGGSLSGFVVGDIQVLNISSPTGGGWILSRFEGTEEDSKWILFNKFGFAEISKDGIYIKDDLASITNDKELASITPFELIINNLDNTCTTGGFSAFKNSIDKKHGGLFSVSLGCAASLIAAGAACTASPSGVSVGACIAALGFVGKECGIPIDAGMTAFFNDYPPKLNIGEWIPTTKTTWRSCYKDDNVGGEEGEILVPVYRAKITLTDDHKPDPVIEGSLGAEILSLGGYVELPAGSCIPLEITDCGGNKINTTVCPPEPTREQRKTWRPSQEEIIEDKIKLTEGEWIGKFYNFPIPIECKNPEILVNNVIIQVNEKGVEGGGNFQLHCTGTPTTSETGPLVTYFINITDFSPETGNGFVGESNWRGSVDLSQTGNCCPPFYEVMPSEIKITNNEVTLHITIPGTNEKAYVSLEKK